MPKRFNPELWIATPSANFGFARPLCKGNIPEGQGKTPRMSQGETLEPHIGLGSWCLFFCSESSGDAETEIWTSLKIDQGRDYYCVRITTKNWRSSQTRSQCKTAGYQSISRLSRKYSPKHWPSCKIMKGGSCNRGVLQGFRLVLWAKVGITYITALITNWESGGYSYRYPGWLKIGERFGSVRQQAYRRAGSLITSKRF